MFGRMFWVAGEAAEGWEKKIRVVDPDPVGFPFSNIKFNMLMDLARSLQQFGQCSMAGQPTQRQALSPNAKNSSKHT